MFHPPSLFAWDAELLDGGGGPGEFLGQTSAGPTAGLTGGTNPHGVSVAFDNSNVAGVPNGCDAASGAGVTTGIEWAIPLAALGDPTGCIRIVALVTSMGGHSGPDQVLPPLPTGLCQGISPCSALDLSAQAGEQVLTICPAGVPAARSTWGRLKAHYRSSAIRGVRGDRAWLHNRLTSGSAEPPQALAPVGANSARRPELAGSAQVLAKGMQASSLTVPGDVRILHVIWMLLRRGESAVSRPSAIEFALSKQGTMIGCHRDTTPGIAADSCRVGPASGRRSATLLVTVVVASLAAVHPAGAGAQPGSAADTVRVDSLAAAPPAPSPADAAGRSLADASSIVSWTEERRQRSTLLPFADHPLPETYPAFSFGIGLASFQSSFRGSGKAFAAVEDSIRAGGYTVPSSSGIRSEGMLLLTLDASFNRSLDAMIQLGHSEDPDNRLRLVGGLVSGRYSPPKADWLSLLAGLGGGAFDLRLQRHYGVSITPVSGSGTYTTLDKIRFKGAGTYGTVAGRLAVRATPNMVIEGAVQYFLMSRLSTDLGGAGRSSVNASGTLLGISWSVFL